MRTQHGDITAGNRANHAAIGQIQKISVLGATGSIGMNALDLVARNPERFQVEALTAHTNVAKLAHLAKFHRAKLAVIGDETQYAELKSQLAGTSIETACGETGLLAAGALEADCTIASIVGAAGLRPSLAAARQGRRVALANKECLVAAGDIFMAAINQAGTELLPVDSEHAAIHQALHGEDMQSVERIVLTASGGPFRTWTKEQIAAATPEQALHHPNWSMGAKITIDSATLMNKGLELIEAYHLFSIDPQRLGILVHPQSIVHCLVSFCDGSAIAQLANPDMRTPIAYSLAWPERMVAPTERLDLVKLQSLTFEAPDLARFPALGLAISALAQGGSAPNILNAANECAVEAFLTRRIGFAQISDVVEKCLDKAAQRDLLKPVLTIDEVFGIDREVRQLACSLMARP